MRKIPTNSHGDAAQGRASARPRRAARDAEDASSQHRLYQALCHAITGGIAKPGEPLPPQRTLAKQTGFRRNAVTSAYERLIADGFAVATVGSGTFVAARIPARVNDARKTRIAIEAPQQGALALGCTHIDAKGAAALQVVCRPADARLRRRAPAIRRPQGQPRAARRDRRSFAVGARAALRSGPDHAGVGNAARLADRAGRDPQARRSHLVRGSRLSRRAKSDRALRPAPGLRAGRRIRHDRGQGPGAGAVGGRGLCDAVAPVSARACRCR